MAYRGMCGSIPRKALIVSFPDTTKRNNKNKSNNIDDDESSKYPNKRWMGDLMASGATNATLKRMVIPGSHGSASYSIPLLNLGKTQKISILEQLLCGIRFLDLRISSGKKKGAVNIFHGRLMGCSFEEVLGEIGDFCRTYPTEFVILHVQPERSRPFPAQTKVKALNLVRSHFGSPWDPIPERLLCKANLRNSVLDTPLHKLVSQRGRVLVILNPRIYNDFIIDGVNYNADYIQKDYGFFDAAFWLRDKWHNTMDTLQLLESNLREIRAHKCHKRRYFVNNQFVLTPSFEGKAIGSYITGKASLHQRGKGIPILHQMIMEHPEEDWNIVSLDFVDLASEAIQLFIGMNFGPLTIELALMGGADGSRRSAEDVTNFVRSKVLKGSCLLLHPKHELHHLLPRIIHETSLTIVYKLSGKLYTIELALSDLTRTQCAVVLNQHNHLRNGATLLTLGSSNEGNGTIPTKRRSGVTVTWQKTAQQTVRFSYQGRDETEKLIDSWTE